MDCTQALFVDEKSRQIYAQYRAFHRHDKWHHQGARSPVTQGLLPTTMNSLKAASPATGMTAVEAPTHNVSGNGQSYYPFSRHLDAITCSRLES